MEVDGFSGLVVFYIDFDEFKKVNDFGGYDVGDDMFWWVVGFFVFVLGEFGIVVWIGGDEFVGMLLVVDKLFVCKVVEEVLGVFVWIWLEVVDCVFIIGGLIGVVYVFNWLVLGICDVDGLLVLVDCVSLRMKCIGG